MQDPQDIRAAQIREVMTTAAAMTIGGVAGRWSADGTQWTADDTSKGDALMLVRISDAEPGDVQGVARQVAHTVGFAEQRGARVFTVLVENDTSAFKRRTIVLPNGEKQLRTVRPKFRYALKLMAAGKVRLFISYHLDRTVRDPRDLEDLIDVVEQSRPRIECQSVVGSLRLADDADITTARVLCAVANQSSRDTARRVRAARFEQAQEGRFGGGPRRFGFEKDGRTIREREAAAIREGTRLGLAGLSVREVARDLNAQGFQGRDGGPFEAAQVRDLLLRPCNAGLSVHRSGERGRILYTRDDVVGTLPGEPMVSPEDYWALVGLWTNPDRRTNHGGTASKWLGSGIFQCPCGDTMRVSAKQYASTDRRTGQVTTVRYQVYRCNEKGPGHATCRQKELDALVAGTVVELVRVSDPAEILGSEGAKVDVAALRADIARHRARLQEAAADYEADVITRTQFLAITKTRREKIENAQARLSQAAESHNPAISLVGADDIEAAWEDLTLGEKREVIRRLLTITVQPVGRGLRVPVRNRVAITRNRRAARTSPSASTVG